MKNSEVQHYKSDPPLTYSFNKNYYNGSFTGLTNIALDIKVEYLNSASTVLATCTI